MDIFDSNIEAFKALSNWRVTLDIVIIALVIFFLYHTLRTTGTWKIMVGIMLASVIFFLARVFDLKGIVWIYSNLSPVFLIGLIILFQPELRKVFERAASLRPREAGREGAKLAHILSEAAFALARKKQGAIFVLPGKDSVTSWTSEGIAIDARLSFPLLMSVFDPHSPGHDGAAIVEYGRLRAFGVRLPVSKISTLSDELGTRHHASMALSEATDALVMAVSEERGVVTVFEQGKAREVTDKYGLSARIISHLDDSTSYELPGLGERKRKVLIVELAISFLLAFLFWSTVVLTRP